MNKNSLAGVSALLLVTGLAAPAQAAVATFDDLPSADGLVPDGYAGINWDGNWFYYGSAQEPYQPASAPNRIYRNAGKFGNDLAAVPFYFLTDSVFNGAAIAGYQDAGVRFELYLDGALVHTTSTFIPTSTATFYASGYSGRVDEVRFTSINYITFDDITFAAVPEPASWTMMIGGVGIAGGALRRRRAAVSVRFA